MHHAHLRFIRAGHAEVLLSMLKSPSHELARRTLKLPDFVSGRRRSCEFDGLEDNSRQRAGMKTPHHRVAANGISTEYRGASWGGMLMMLFKVEVNL